MFTSSHDQFSSGTDGYCSTPLVQNKKYHETSSRPPSLKRKRSDDSDAPLKPFDILPYPNSNFDAPVSASPLFILPRHLLSLSYIDHTSSSSLLSTSRFFSANITVLEAHATNESIRHCHNLLLVRLDHDETIHAVERVRRGIYAICQLGDWVDVAKIQTQASIHDAGPTLFSRTAPTTQAGEEWWASLTVAKRSKHGRTLSEQQEADNLPQNIVHVAQGTQLLNVSTHRNTSTLAVLDSTETLPLDNAANKIPAPADTDTANVVIQQYLETLYLSGTSLAYFAKGPLSRARTVHLEARTLPVLAEVLRSLVITVTLADKRYRDTLPELLKSTEDYQVTDEARAKDKKKKKPKRRPKAARRAKDGLLPGEKDVLVQWWAMQDSSVSATANFESRLRAGLPKLRFRETLLQLVLILETLALEKQVADTLVATKDTIDGSSAGAEPGTTTKKPKDLESLAQTLVDRLMIWQSVEVVSGKSQRMQEDTTSQDLSQPLLPFENSDKIRDFCTDTMIPFYGIRIPGLVAALSEKMGMPLASPVRSKRAAADVVTKLAPGTAISRTRAPASDRRKPLSRVSSETSKKASAMPPSLLRSATESNLQELKRERSSTPRLPSFDTAESRVPSRNGMTVDVKQSKDRGRRSLSRANSMNQPSKSFGQREVDLSAITKYHEAKARQKDNVERELKDAIATLKKPNRGLAVKDLAGEAEARNAKLPKVPAIAQRNAHLGVQVNATPKRFSKKRDAIAATPDRPDLHPENCDFESIPSSNAFIPSSTIRPAHPADRIFPQASTQVLHTPSRIGKNSRYASQSAMAAPLVAEQTPHRPASGLGVRPSARNFENSFLTPTKPGAACSRPWPYEAAGQATVLSTPGPKLSKAVHPSASTVLYPSEMKENQTVTKAPRLQGRDTATAGPKSIYESLGWDDDDELM